MDLEKKNFAFAGKTLAEIWSNTVINDFPVVAEFVHAGDHECKEVDAVWHAKHVRYGKLKSRNHQVSV